MALIPFEDASGSEMLKTKDVNLAAEVGTGWASEGISDFGNSRTQARSLF